MEQKVYFFILTDVMYSALQNVLWGSTLCHHLTINLYIARYIATYSTTGLRVVVVLTVGAAVEGLIVVD